MADSGQPERGVSTTAKYGCSVDPDEGSDRFDSATERMHKQTTSSISTTLALASCSMQRRSSAHLFRLHPECAQRNNLRTELTQRLHSCVAELIMSFLSQTKWVEGRTG